jgi:hypothetical protein
MNALTLGLSSPDGQVTLPTESREKFDLFEEALLANLTRKRKLEVTEIEALRIKAGVKDPKAISAVTNESALECLEDLIDEAVEAKRKGRVGR